jgi:hypothetical protein
MLFFILRNAFKNEILIDRNFTDTLNTRFLPHGATTKIRKTAPLFKLDDKTITLSGESFSAFQIVIEYV